MTRKEKAMQFAALLDKEYPDADCTLDHLTPLQLLVSVQLSAQCTDARVNMVTPALFERYKTADDFANADIHELESCIHSVGFYHNKAKNLINCCKKLCENFGGEVPSTMDELLTLDGVGRKSANVILGDVFGRGGMVIDTHAKRILRLVGLTKETDPEKIEFDTEKLLPREVQSKFCHALVLHGRAVCIARRPKCKECAAKEICNFAKKNLK